jgi:dephospho-CoA kinase
MIIGITGTIGAGKGAVVSYLVHNKGFAHYSARTLFHTHMQAAGMTITRDTMAAYANDCRARYGSQYVFDQLWKEAKAGGAPAIIESIRTMGEATALKQEGGILLSVDAEQKMRYERIHGRGSVLDEVTFDEFKTQESREMHSLDPNKQSIVAVMAVADYRIVNNGTLSELHEKIEAILNDIDKSL